MLTLYDLQSGKLIVRQNAEVTEQTVWIDLLNPTPEDEKLVEDYLDVDVPTAEEQMEIEASSRLYKEDRAYFMTATLIYHLDHGEPATTPVTFILAGSRLITVRYAEPRAFAIFAARCNRSDAILTNGTAVLLGLMDTIIDRLADFIERIQKEVGSLSRAIFEIKGSMASRQRRYDVMLRSIGREGDLTSKARESAYTLGRLLTYAALAANERNEDAGLRSRIKSASRDVTSLTDQIAFLSGKIIFLLDATLGMINIQQADIIRIVSIAAVVFLPPTLVASIYGMNFQHMPELQWPGAYPVVLIVIALAAVLPYLFFKRKGWL